MPRCSRSPRAENRSASPMPCTRARICGSKLRPMAAAKGNNDRAFSSKRSRRSPMSETARARAAQAGVADRVVFEVATSTNYAGSGYDLVAHFDCLHDMGDPAAAARYVRQTLAADGTWMVVEPFAGDQLEDNLHPLGRVFYAASTLLCVPNSRAAEGVALGAQAGEGRLRRVALEGGFTRFRRAAETPFNLVLEARP